MRSCSDLWVKELIEALFRLGIFFCGRGRSSFCYLFLIGGLIVSPGVRLKLSYPPTNSNFSVIEN